MRETESNLPSRVTDEQVIEQPQTKMALDKQFVGKLVASAEPSVLNLERFKGSGTVLNVTYFNKGQDGQRIVILGDGTTTIVHNAARIKTNTAANKLLAVDKVYRFTRYDDVWVEDDGGSGGGGGGAAMEFYSTGVLIDTVLVNPRPTVDTDFPGLSLVIAASGVARTFLLSAYVFTTLVATAANNVRMSVHLDGVKQFDGGHNGIMFSISANIDSIGRRVQLTNFPIVIPGDAAAHTVSFRYNAVGTTASITYEERYLVALQVA